MPEQGWIEYSTAQGRLRLNGVEMHCPAFDVTNAGVLWTRPRRRFGNTTIPFVAGDLANPVRIAAATYGMRMTVSGVYDMDGVYWRDDGLSSPMEGLERTLDFLESEVFEPATPPDATIDGDLLMPSGDLRVAPDGVQITAVDAPPTGHPVIRVTFDLVVPQPLLVAGS